jgi:nucleoside-diphosphate-sugar epimerase
MSKGLILVTGCSGRIGTRVMKHFASHYQVVGFDIKEPKKLPPNVEFMQMDLSSEESISNSFKKVKEKYGDHVVSMVHLAAFYSFTGDNPELYDKITVRGTERILHQLQSFNCEQFIFSSTQLVMATCKVGEKINEDSPVNANWDYPLSKIKTEKILHTKRGKIPVVSLRIVGCYDDECHSIPISNQIQRIYEKQLQSRVFPGNLKCGAPFMHLEDLVEAISLSVEKRKDLPPDLTLLIGEDETMSTDQLQRRISRLCHGTEFTTIRIPKIVAKIGAWLQWKLPGMPETFIRPWMIDLADGNWTLDVSRAKKYLGWKPKHRIHDVLPGMIEYLKRDPLSFYKENLLKAPKWLQKKFENK